ncbi:MAG: prepilin-type N-terminal cleavage/methylation domain-containing protein [Geobacteraceae bacterium]|jgi:type IV pilus assembly protein PilV
MPRVRLSDNGFTLIEVVVSILILVVGMLGLLGTINVAIQHNMMNQLRNEATRVADAEMAREMGKGFNNVSTTPANFVRTRQFMLGSINFQVNRAGNTLANSKWVSYTVTWGYKKAQYNTTISSVISPPPQ